MKCGGYLITYRRIGDSDDCIILLDKKWKLIWWMITTGCSCKAVLIAYLQDGDDE